jgi:hypothetical protein
MGSIFKVPAIIIYALGGIWGFFIMFQILNDAFGFIGAIISIIILPVVLYLGPLYVGFVDGNWFPATICYGSAALAIVLFFIGSYLDQD